MPCARAARTGEVGDGKVFVIDARAGGPDPHRRERHAAPSRPSTTMIGALADRRRTINAGDTAWMLVATALVLMMTPALGLFYAGLVRSQEHAQHVHDEHRRARRRDGLVGAGRLLARVLQGQRVRRRLPTTRLLRGVGFGAARRHRHPAAAVLRLRGGVLHHHRRPRLGSGRRADALRRRSWCSWCCGRCWCTPCSRTGSGAVAGCRRTARWTSPAACPSRWHRASRRSPPRWWSAPAGTTGARRCCRTTRCYVLLGRRPAVVRLVRLQRRQRPVDRPCERARLRQHAAGPGLHAGGLVRPRPGPRPAGHGARRRDRDHRRRVGDHPGRRLHQPDLGDAARRDRRAAQLRADPLAPAHPARRVAGRPRRARARRPDAASCSSASLPSSRGTASPTACSSAMPAQLGWQAIAAARRPGLRLRRDRS